MAADLPARMPVKAAPAPIITVFSWTGCYIGGHAGYAWGKKRVDFTPNVFGLDFDHDVDGFIAGGQVGCNLWQRDRWVFGIEGQASWADIDGSVGPFPGHYRRSEQLPHGGGYHWLYRGTARLCLRRDRTDSVLRQGRSGVHP